MLSSKLDEIAQQLQQALDLNNNIDRPLIDKLKQIRDKVDGEELKAEHVSQIQQLLAERWRKIINSPLNYTVCHQGINDYWISLAKLLAPGLDNMPWIKLLIPTLEVGTKLSKYYTDLSIVNLHDVILSEDGKSLISFPSLCRIDIRENKLKLGDESLTPVELKHVKIHQLNRKDARRLKALDSIRVKAVKTVCTELLELSPDRKPSCDRSLAIKIRKYFFTRKDDDFINARDVQFLQTIYAVRWQKIMDGNYDYTRMLKGANALWLNVAKSLDYWQCLGEGKTAYHLMIPTIQNPAEDTISMEALTASLLTDCVVSEDGCELISLKHSKQYYQTHNVWRVVSQLKTKVSDNFKERLRDFTDLEIKRYTFNQKLMAFLKANGIVRQIEIAPISRYTWQQLFFLLQLSYFKEGHSQELTGVTQTRITYAYQNFAFYMESLDHEERQALESQLIELGGRALTFAVMWQEVTLWYVKETDQQCVTGYANHLYQLICSYDKRPASLKQFKSLDEPRGVGSRSFSTDTLCTDDKFSNFFNFIKQVIDTHPFPTNGGGKTLKLSRGKKITAPDSIKKIYQYAQQSLANNNVNSRSYDLMIQTYIIPKLLDLKTGRDFSTNVFLMGILLLPLLYTNFKLLFSRVFMELDNLLLTSSDRAYIESLAKYLADHVKMSHTSKPNYNVDYIIVVITNHYLKLSSGYQEYFLRSIAMISSHQCDYLLSCYDQRLIEVNSRLDSYESLEIKHKRVSLFKQMTTGLCTFFAPKPTGAYACSSTTTPSHSTRLTVM